MAGALRLLIINKKLSFSLKLKNTLEQLGGFEVAPFTAAETALDYLKKHPQHIAMVDFTLPGTPGLDMVLELRAIQPEIAIIATPDRPEVSALMHQLNLAGIVDAPISARELIPVLRDVIQRKKDVLPDTAEATILRDDYDTGEVNASATPPPDTLPGESSGFQPVEDDPASREKLARTIEFVLQADVDALDQIEDPRLPDGINQQAVQLFQQLAAEEPPMPDLEESGTVHDLRNAMNSTDMRRLSLALDQLRVPPPLLPGGSDAASTAQDALRAVSDESLSLSQLQTALKTDFPETQGIKPLPSWVDHRKRYVEEPDFLEEVNKNAVDLDALDLSAQATDMFNPDDLLQSPADAETDRFMPEKPSVLPPYEFDASAAEPEDDQPEDLPDDRQSAELPADQPVSLSDAGDRTQSLLQRQSESQANEPKHVVMDDEYDDPQVAQVALGMTQAALEMSAEATVLARKGQVIAYAGSLPREEVEAMNEALAEDWDAQPGQARIRFVTSATSGRDYMIYSRLTEEGFALSMIFAGHQPLSVVRTQSDRVLRAMFSVPEPRAVRDASLLDELQERELRKLEAEAAQEVETALESTSEIIKEHGEGYAVDLDEPLDIPQLPEPTFTGPLTGYTFIWMLRDPQMTIPRRIGQLMARELERHLTEVGWVVENLQVLEDYVYILIEVPGDAQSREIVADLMHRSAHIIGAIDDDFDVDMLWADSYCVLSPGREMEVEEIQRYINFARMSR
jgi:DNA-binding NarL/FixJ family response regulator/REP element-mobilizing transposase RayT